jgi:S1-C subfamily serine protease
MRKKTVVFRLLSSGEENIIFKKAESIREAYGNEFNEYNTMKLKSHIVAIGDKTDRSYIDKFVDAMPALDAFTIRKKMSDLGEEIFTLGYPRNDNDIVYGKGYLSAQKGYEGDSNSYQIQINANPGSSGAPLFNDKSELIGIISTREKLAVGVAFAIKSNKIIDLIASVKGDEVLNEKADVKLKITKVEHANSNNRKVQINNLKPYIFSIRSYN